MNTLTKIRIRRWVNHRSNGVIEQIEKVVLRLQKWIKRLEDEQDAANEAMKAELLSMKERATNEIAEMEQNLKDRKDALKAEQADTKASYEAVINESRQEADRARQVQTNIQALTSG